MRASVVEETVIQLLFAGLDSPDLQDTYCLCPCLHPNDLGAHKHMDSFGEVLVGVQLERKLRSCDGESNGFDVSFQIFGI